MCGPKCEKVPKPWVLRLKHWSLSMGVSAKEWRELSQVERYHWFR